MRSTLENRFLEFNRKNRLFQTGDRVLVAVSGGVDSVVLLSLLMKMKLALNIEPGVVHLNHLLRGEKGDQDECFVSGLADNHNLTFYPVKYPVRDFAAEHGLSLEEAGHRLRRQLFEEISRENGYDKIATGHQLDDQAETILMRLINGTGMQGLSGIRLKIGKWVRPLLFASREDIQEYARQNGIQFREDETNRDISILRNRIRNRLLPILKKEFNPDVTDHLAHLAAIMGEWDTLAVEEVEKCLKTFTEWTSQNKIRVGIDFFQQYFSGIRIRLIEHVLARLQGENYHIGFRQFSDFSEWINRKTSGTHFRWNSHLTTLKKKEFVEFVKIPENHGNFQILNLNPGETVVLPDAGQEISLDAVTDEEVRFSENRKEEFIAGDKFRFPLKLRKWQNGDRFIPLGMRGKKLISDFLTDRKIGFPERDYVYVLLNNDDIIAIPGIQISERYRIHENSKKKYRLTIRESEK